MEVAANEWKQQQTEVSATSPATRSLELSLLVKTSRHSERSEESQHLPGLGNSALRKKSRRPCRPPASHLFSIF
jgi:hypothetical protein